MTKNRREKGVVLILTFIIMTTLTAIVVAFLSLTSIQTKGSGYNIADSQALWLAEAGIQKAFYTLKNDASYQNSPTTISGTLGGGTYSVSCVKNANTYTFTSTGTVSSLNRKITQSVVVGSTPEAFEYSFHGAHDIDFGNSSGTVNGADISAIHNINHENKMHFGSGVDLIEGSTVATPTVNLSTYAALATKTVSGNKTFTAGTYTGIWYVTGKVTINDGVIFNGTIVAGDTIATQDNAKITLNPTASYPALITQTGKNITLKINESTITGLIYCGNDFTIDGKDKVIAINGSLIAGHDMNLSNLDNTTITYNSNLFSNPPPGFSANGGTVTISVQKDWNEIVPAI